MNGFFEKLKEEGENLWQSIKDEGQAMEESEEDYLNSEHDLFAWADGSLMSLPAAEGASEKDQAMKTIAVMTLDADRITAPCTGKILQIIPSQNTIVIEVDPRLKVAIKICMSGLSFNQNVQMLAGPGDEVAKGQVIARLDQTYQIKSKLLMMDPDPADYGYARIRENGPVSEGMPIVSLKDKRND